MHWVGPVSSRTSPGSAPRPCRNPEELSMIATCMRLLVLAAALAVAAPTVAQTMEFACPTPGTIFTYDSGVSVVARGQEGMDCAMENVGGKPFKVRALLISNPSSDGSNTSALIAALRPERLWPLKVGNRIEATY